MKISSNRRGRCMALSRQTQKDNVWLEDNQIWLWGLLINYPYDSSNAIRETELRAGSFSPWASHSRRSFGAEESADSTAPPGACPSGGNRLWTAQTRRVKADKKTSNGGNQRQTWKVKERGRGGKTEEAWCFTGKDAGRTGRGGGRVLGIWREYFSTFPFKLKKILILFIQRKQQLNWWYEATGNRRKDVVHKWNLEKKANSLKTTCNTNAAREKGKTCR